jgi:DNA-binding NtrC family response regulator
MRFSKPMFGLFIARRTKIEASRLQRSVSMVVKHKRKALLIEDEMLVAWSIKEVLEEGGFGPVYVATTDSSAKAACCDGDIDLIVCDLDLGPLSANGLAILRAVDPDETIPTLVYTAIDADLVERSVFENRPRATVLQKPVDEHRLVAIAQSMIEARSDKLYNLL